MTSIDNVAITTTQTTVDEAQCDYPHHLMMTTTMASVDDAVTTTNISCSLLVLLLNTDSITVINLYDIVLWIIFVAKV